MHVIRCRYCHKTMSLAWPATATRGSIMSCDRAAGGCGATCQANGGKTWDWKGGDRCTRRGT